MKDERVSPEVSSGDRVLLGQLKQLEDHGTPHLNNGGRGRDQWPGRKLPPANIAHGHPLCLVLCSKLGIYTLTYVIKGVFGLFGRGIRPGNGELADLIHM